MQITQVELKNVKSYDESTAISFAPGVNAICGPNGAGKSTILEAIGFALFDALPYKQKQFLREGKKRGEIVVSFVDALDEREYQVVRRIGGGTPYVYDPEVKGRVVSGKANVVDWTKQHLGIEPSASLKTLFRDAVGVPQGTLTAPFQETRATVRKAKFDPLLQVDDYQQAWEKLRGTASFLRDQVEDQERLIAKLEGQLMPLPEREQTTQDLRSQIADDGQALEDVSSDLAQGTKEDKELNALKARIGDLTSSLAVLKGKLGELNNRLVDAEAGVEEAKTAQDAAERAEPGHRAYEAAAKHLTELDTRRKKRDDLRETLKNTERDLALVSQTIETQRGILENITKAEARLKQLEPLVSRQGELETTLKRAEQDVQQLHEAGDRLSHEKQRLVKLQESLTQVKEDIQTRLELEARAGDLSALRSQRDEELADLEARLSDLENSLTEVAETRSAAKQEAWEWEQASQRLAEDQSRLDSLEVDLEKVGAKLQQRVRTEVGLADLLSETRQLEKQLGELGQKQVLLQEQRRALNERMRVLEKAEEAQCPVCQQPLTDEDAAELTARYEEERKALNKQLETLRRDIKALEASLDALGAQGERLNRRLDGLPRPQRKDELLAEIETQQAIVAGRKEQVTLLAGAPEQATVEQERHERLQRKANALKTERKTLIQRRNEASHQIDEIQGQIADLTRPERESQLLAEIEVQDGDIAKQRARVGALSDAPDRVVYLKGEIEILDDPRREQNQCLAEVERRPSVEEALAKARKERSEFEAIKAETEEGLLVYANLDEAIAGEQTLLNQHEAYHQQYLKNLQVAQTLVERQRKLNRLLERRKQLEAEQRQVEQKLGAAQAGYNEEQHGALGQELSQLTAEQAALDERLRQNTTRLREVEDEVEALHLLQSELTKAEQERDEMVSLNAAMRFVRETIRDAGPYVTRRLVQAISVEADRVFGEVIGDHTMRLAWSDDYAVTVDCRGEERAFQQLSGGEQMAAALAVRLALLRQMSDVDIVFFDEPTANLDDERRDNLAEQITGITGFSQLFVISHDDTFEQGTHRVIRVRKEDGVSRVEVA